MKLSIILRTVFALFFATLGNAFLSPASFRTSLVPKTQRLFDSAADDFGDAVQDVVDAVTEPFDRAALKRKLIKYGASYNRGFGASATALKEADKVIEELESINKMKNATIGIEGKSSEGESPLRGTWQMIWCTAPDILVLEASPLTTVGAIYQVYEPPKVTNIIDFIPRAQLLLPTSIMAPSLFRAQVTTRAFEREDEPDNRIGLRFESVKVRAVEVLGNRNIGLPPLNVNFPQLDNLDVLNPKTGPGYFDVKYLDGDLLIIEQNQEASGGVIALIKVDDAEP